ncbi:PAS domain-containing sensor histidine kinase [Clostridium ganghwense]|uniref:histidine kinase n=1 Tax=Clostridium ganghwense TaxID=312089 RepID=A0ABT4CJE6_9CLOT|nr:PAS domain-containing sensor histidine kinase [Clostridium ganghwense]MCY6369170.1 PAS domain-containing sensor histidine kinase [Clostridium ganghwense]
MEHTNDKCLYSSNLFLKKLVYLLYSLIFISFIFVAVYLFSGTLFDKTKDVFTNLTYIILFFVSLFSVIVIENIKKIVIKKENETDNLAEFYLRIIESLPISVLVHHKLKFVFANKLGAELIGVKNSKELLGKDITEFVILNMEKVGDQRVEGAREGKKVKPLVEDTLTRKDGTKVEIEIVTNPISYENSIAVLALCKDITERKQAEELKKKIEEERKLLEEAKEYDKLRTEFFANLSHEFKTPLNLIFSVIQLLEMKLEKGAITEQKDTIDKYLKILKQNGYRLLRLVNNLIDLTKIHSGYFDLELTNCNIVSLIEDVTLSTVEYAKNKNIHVKFDTNIEEKVIACDIDKIERIMLNLLSNAIKFTKPKGNIFVVIRDKEDKVVISVKDDGVGIEKQKLKIIFERFRQVDKSLNRNNEGSGIGLSLVKSLAEMHDGKIYVESEYGKGTEFIVELPIKLVEEKENISDYMIGNEAEKMKIEFSDIYH